jgi:hypothetical protein
MSASVARPATIFSIPCLSRVVPTGTARTSRRIRRRRNRRIAGDIEHVAPGPKIMVEPPVDRSS